MLVMENPRLGQIRSVPHRARLRNRVVDAQTRGGRCRTDARRALQPDAGLAHFEFHQRPQYFSNLCD